MKDWPNEAEAARHEAEVADLRTRLAASEAERERLREQLSDDGSMRLEGKAAEKFLADMERVETEPESEKRRQFLKECDDLVARNSPLAAAQRALAAAQAENVRLREYLRHRNDCKTLKHPAEGGDYSCDCGLSATLAQKPDGGSR